MLSVLYKTNPSKYLLRTFRIRKTIINCIPGIEKTFKRLLEKT